MAEYVPTSLNISASSKILKAGCLETINIGNIIIKKVKKGYSCEYFIDGNEFNGIFFTKEGICKFIQMSCKQNKIIELSINFIDLISSQINIETLEDYEKINPFLMDYLEIVSSEGI